MEPRQPLSLDYESSPSVDQIIARQRMTFIICTWCCGALAIMTIPTYPPFPGAWIPHGLSRAENLPWLSPFCCGIASLATAVLLYRLPRKADQIGAVLSILICGWWPPLLAINWWVHCL